MGEFKASTHNEGRSVDAVDRRPDKTRNVASQNHAGDRLGASRRTMASMVRVATMQAMLASIAHDVSQPLTALVTSANAGLRWLGRPEPDLDEVRTLLARIVKDGHRAGEVIADIRSKFGEDRNEPSAVSPYEVIADVLALVDDELGSRRISVRNEMPAGLPQLMAERARLQLAFFNLLVNAIEAMESVTDRDRVLTITSQLCDSDDLLITFEDSGMGIDPDYMDRLFEAFVTSKAHRAGMGLPICRKIIEAQGGRVWASACHPHGSAFFVRLPIAAASGK
jgi:C4-dicarboxylate-specific signal transduction histidine kinase